MAIFADRVAAGRELAASLAPWRGADAVVLGIPRGGVVVAAEVADGLGLPLGVVVVRKVGAPGHEEFAVGAIAEGVRVIDDEALRLTGATAVQLSAVERRERGELARRRELFARDTPSAETVIVIDDGLATGATATAACRAERARGSARIVLAVPVAPERWRPDRTVVDEFVCPHRERDFWAVGQFYDDFAQTTDEEVLRLLARDLPAR